MALVGGGGILSPNIVLFGALNTHPFTTVFRIPMPTNIIDTFKVKNKNNNARQNHQIFKRTSVLNAVERSFIHWQESSYS